MLRFNICARLFVKLTARLMLLTGVVTLCSAQPCLASSLKKNRLFPLIIMGGHWSAHHLPDYSDLSRVCDAGFTHVFSYYTETMLSTELTLTGAVNNALEFVSTVKENCPGLGLAVGIPRRWIYEGRLNLIAGYVSELKAKNVDVDYWLSDEMIHQMTSEGLSLQEAGRRAREAIDAVKKISNAPYIWIEPGNYDRRTSMILDVLNDLPAGIKSYDEYVISKTGRLSRSQSGFDSMLHTLKLLKSKGNRVFPVCEINYIKKKKIVPLEEELAAISISLFMEGADGLVFYEERWTTPEILQSLKKISTLITCLNDFGGRNFLRTKDVFTSWEAKSDKRTLKVVLNTTGLSLDVTVLQPANSVVVWPSGGNIKELKPMELLVYYYD